MITIENRAGHALTFPVLEGMQAQGDLIVIPSDLLPFTLRPAGDWVWVPAEGWVVLDGVHPHVLVARPGTCRVKAFSGSSPGLELALFEATAPVYLMHAEHGATGFAPGSYTARRQREWTKRVVRPVAD